jgi:hypothetical protein
MKMPQHDAPPDPENGTAFTKGCLIATPLSLVLWALLILGARLLYRLIWPS